MMMAPIGTPKVPYRTPGEGGWQWVDIWNVLYRERIIFLGQYIDEEFGNQIVATMLYLDSVDSTKPMYLYINCPGGDITPCMAIYDTMESIRSPVGTLALGYAYNNAGLLLAAGAKGMRTAMPLTRVALMSPAGAARGQADDIINEARELSRVRNYVYEQISKKTGQPVDKVMKDLNRIKRFSAKEALDYGIIDKIVRPKRIKPDARRQESIGVGLG
jgi:ATP-dependent Clp protease protease subunit